MREIVQTNKAGKRWQVSVGSGSVPASMQRFIPDGEQTTINGQVQTGPIIIVTTPIREVSFVPVGADLHNAVEIFASNLKGTNLMTFEQWLEEKGFDLSTLNDTNKAALVKIFEAETAEPTQQEPAPVSANSTDGDEVLPEDKPPVQASGMPHRRNPSNLGTASVGTMSRAGTPAVIEASLLMSGGLTDNEVEKLGYNHQTINQAVSREHRGMNLQSLFHAVISAAGMYTLQRQ